jgi:hypothetical protein
VTAQRPLATLAALAAALGGCGGERSGVPSVSLTWTAVDTINAALPPGIRVFAGHSATMPLRAWYASIEERRPEIETRVVLSDDTTDRRETVSSFAEMPRACVAVNAGYFSMDLTPALHAGLLYIDSAIRAPATRTVTRDRTSYPVARAAIGFTDDDHIELAWVTTRSDSLFARSEPPPHLPGSPAELPGEADSVWRVRDAVSAGPMLVWRGAMRITADEEVFFGSAIPSVHPRTAAGRTADGRLLLLVVDGRQPESRGVDLRELAVIMRDLGAVDALNLDGGGSSALVVGGVPLNRPSGRSEQREVMSALVTFCHPAAPAIRTVP